MKWTDISTGKAHSAFQHFMVALGDEADVVVDRINAEPVFAERLAVYARNGGVEASASQKRAREIMGDDFIGPTKVIEARNISATENHQKPLDGRAIIEIITAVAAASATFPPPSLKSYPILRSLP